MKTRLLNVWEKLHSSDWFIPSIMTVAPTGLSSLVIFFDHRFDSWAFAFLPWGVEAHPA
jgi:hypothetical protein